MLRTVRLASASPRLLLLWLASATVGKLLGDCTSLRLLLRLRVTCRRLRPWRSLRVALSLCLGSSCSQPAAVVIRGSANVAKCARPLKRLSYLT